MSDEITRQDILLESGTNEMEIMEFYLGSQSFGINVHKLREIVPFNREQLTVLPENPPTVEGSFLIRGNSIPLINLDRHLARTPEERDGEDTRRIVLICEFNKAVNGFLVDGVNQIHRVSWSDIQPMSSYIEQYRPRFTGSIQIEGREILIIDLEHIIAEIDPNMGMAYDKVSEEMEEKKVESDSALSITEKRQKMKLMLAEDSAIIRSGIIKVLTSAGYTQLETFVDGQECHTAINAIAQAAKRGGEPIDSHLSLLITDIEMPKMDGLTLCRKIREEMDLKDLPILIFSSLINEQMIYKCESVGANGYVTKPQIPELVELVDNYVLK